jgi:hypothetical protein
MSPASSSGNEGPHGLIRKALSEALASVRLEGELVHKEGGKVAVRRGASVFEALSKDIIETRELDGNKVAVLLKPDAELIRSSVIRSVWSGSAIGFRPVFDDCTECCDCTECSVCTDCTECSVCTGDFGAFRTPSIGLTSSWIRRVASMAAGFGGSQRGR